MLWYNITRTLGYCCYVLLINIWLHCLMTMKYVRIQAVMMWYRCLSKVRIMKKSMKKVNMMKRLFHWSMMRCLKVPRKALLDELARWWSVWLESRDYHSNQLPNRLHLICICSQTKCQIDELLLSIKYSLSCMCLW